MMWLSGFPIAFGACPLELYVDHLRSRLRQALPDVNGLIPVQF